MCGICGYHGIDDKNLLRRMSRKIKHRGPDDSGYYFDKSIGLANRRLSIIDIRGGHQPMSNEEGTVWITYNGEIYNFSELKKDLEEKGHRFSTNTDTEVIVHSYEEYGEGCVNRFNGMFAFAIWDQRKNRLFIARDRLGIKPLYYASFGGVFLFASEIKSILEYKKVREIDLESLNLFFSFRYAPWNRTMFLGINRLMPGHTLSYENGKILIKKYWDLKHHFDGRKESSLAQMTKTFSKLFLDSVEKRLMSDVPLGVFLSSGVDSANIVAQLNRLKQPIRTFSLGFNEKNDELRQARRVSEFFNTEHDEIILGPGAIEEFPKMVYHLDEPLADTTIIPVFYLSRLCRKKDTRVILTGEGADELFAGYEQYKIMKAIRWFPGFSAGHGRGGLVLRILTTAAARQGWRSYLNLTSIFTPEDKKRLYAGYLLSKVDLYKDQKIARDNFRTGKYTLESMQYHDINTFLPQLLMKTDRMTMANSVEARVPYLDHRIVELSAMLPPDMKLRGFYDKYILRKSASKYLPGKIVKRKKQRFFVPIDSWYDKGIKDFAIQYLQEPALSRFFNMEYVKRLVDYRKCTEYRLLLKHNAKSRIFYSRQLWNIFAFSVWYKQFIEN